ncbi:MAG: hypothetical protein J2O48_10755, partial [Solirubrobacterales bacterium]|nr:hypothetical protein [Solirubrobacterales bacterium]
SRDGLWEVEPLRSTTPTGVSIGPLPELEPLLPTPEPELICVALANRRHAQLFSRHRGGELEELDLTDRVHGQIRQGGMAQRRYQRTIELQVDEHLRRVAAVLYELWRERDFDRLVLGGPHEAVCRLRAQLHADLSPLLDDHELTTDMSDDSPPKVEADLTPLRDSWRRDAERQALSELTSGQEPATALGPADTLAAANQKLVRTLVLAPDADSRANVCPNCSQLYGETEGACPADGETLVPLPSMRNALIRATVRDGGDVLVLHTSDPSAFSGIGALLRA